MANPNEMTTEVKIQSARLTAPRIIPDDIDDLISIIQYHQFEKTNTVVCCITLTNGSNIIGSSAPVSPENFNVEICRELAFQQARNKIWELEEYLLNHQLYTGQYERNFN